MRPFCASGLKTSCYKSDIKGKNEYKGKTYPRGGDCRRRGRGILPGNAARAVPPHTVFGWVSSA